MGQMPSRDFEKLDGAFRIKIVAIFELVAIYKAGQFIQARASHAPREHDAAVLIAGLSG